MKKLWLTFLIALLAMSCGDDKSYSPEEEEFSESTDVDSTHTGHHSHRQKYSSSSKHGSSDSKQNPDDPFAPKDSSNIHVGDLLNVPGIDSLRVDTSVVSTKKELPSCTAANEGETFMVDEDSDLYFCINGEWRTSVLGLVKASCSDGVLTVDPFSPTDLPDEVDPAFADTYRRVAAPIAGVAQKGPFRYGASVKIVELDSAKRMADSRRIHESCITSGDGSYAFPGVNLVSPYVRVEVTGYYRNEISGGLSPSMVTLHSVTDVTERDSVNVNILTHLESPRLMKLVENSGFNQPIRSMKAQALTDILASFNIDLGGSHSSGGGNNSGWFFGGGRSGGQTSTTSSSKTSDEVNLFAGDEYSAALLAISVMMQRKGAGREMVSYADGIAERIKGNGNWDDNNAKADLADWLMELDASGGYERIRRVFASWGHGEAPDFEKHLRNFWAKVYGFETCNSYTAGQVKNVNTSLSAYFAPYYDHPDSPKIRFICDGTLKSWRVATDIEKDTVGFGMGTYDGQIRGGKINVDKYYVYERSKRTWREATSKEVMPFADIKDVYENLAADETVVFILRHAERTDDTGKNGHLTDNGKKQSESVGAKLKGVDIYLANSGYTRTIETCEGVGKGNGMTVVKQDSLPFLNGDWYVKNSSRLEDYRNSDGGGWVVFSKYAYQGGYTDALYDLDTRSEEYIKDYIIPYLPNMKRVNVLISHDQLVLPLVVYCTQKRVNLRYFDNQRWINYLAGVAIIVNSKGDIRYEPVRGLESGSMTM
ncbi:MAG: histidine phosphatase family protein [Fibrobacter sp.]|nr:histidine phosphatase family protein [Fibrobacter sp.]